MTFDDYQQQSRHSIIVPELVSDLKYLGIALAEESGEVAGKIKKLLRDKSGIVDEEFTESAKKELGDMLWYIARICDTLKISFSQVAGLNIEKGISRMKRNQIHGSGDNR